MAKLGSFLDRHKTVEELVFDGIGFNEKQVIELADSLMRIKPLKFFRCRGSNSFGKGMAALIYNLSFSPSLETVDLSNCSFTEMEMKELSISLVKLIKMNTSLRNLLLMRCTKNTNQHLGKNFWLAVGDNQNLRFMGLSYAGAIKEVECVGHGIAFNAKRKGALEYLLLEEALPAASVKKFYEGL